MLEWWLVHEAELDRMVDLYVFLMVLAALMARMHGLMSYAERCELPEDWTLVMLDDPCLRLHPRL